MIRTIILLLITIVVVPLIAIKYDSVTPETLSLLQELVTIALGVALFTYTIAEITGNCSQIDKLWSLLPIGYSWYVYAQFPTSRVLLMAILATVWGLRLSYNFARRGGYSWKFWTGEEDYRWEVLRKKPFLNSPWKWRLFNLFFISGYQSLLILFFTLPIVVVAQTGDAPISFADYVIAGLLLLFVVLETIADQQQWTYQTEKYRRKNAGEALGEEYARGFVNSGLWGIVRHPNYASEQAIWICFYLFSASATGRPVNWSVMGVLLLILLFQGSADFSEGISEEKYPAYAAYKKKVGRYLPKLF